MIELMSLLLISSIFIMWYGIYTDNDVLMLVGLGVLILSSASF